MSYLFIGYTFVMFVFAVWQGISASSDSKPLSIQDKTHLIFQCLFWPVSLLIEIGNLTITVE